jgi:hypothetical protein
MQNGKEKIKLSKFNKSRPTDIFPTLSKFIPQLFGLSKNLSLK